MNIWQLLSGNLAMLTFFVSTVLLLLLYMLQEYYEHRENMARIREKRCSECNDGEYEKVSRLVDTPSDVS